MLVVFFLSFNIPPAPSITVSVTPNLNTPLMVGQTDNTLNCGVSGADNLDPTTTYRWTRDGGREVSRSSTLPLSPVGLSDAGNYTCHATVNSNLLTNDVIRTANQIVMVQGESVTLVLATVIINSWSIQQSQPCPLLLSPAALAVTLFSIILLSLSIVRSILDKECRSLSSHC